jgi:hypothetical protein
VRPPNVSVIVQVEPAVAVTLNAPAVGPPVLLAIAVHPVPLIAAV